jgi:hypothetical protein
MSDEQTTKTITISEFRHWLSGVEEMQPDDWCPDKRQWDRIREKIDSISSEPTNVVKQVAPHISGHQYADSQPVYQDNRPVQLAPSGMGRVSAPPPSGVLFGNAENPAFPIKTPTIDTSTGPYEPAFI